MKTSLLSTQSAILTRTACYAILHNKVLSRFLNNKLLAYNIHQMWIIVCAQNQRDKIILSEYFGYQLQMLAFSNLN